MAKVAKVSFDKEIGSYFQKIKDKKILDEIGEELESEVKDFIAKGISPVKGVSRFTGYVSQRDPAATQGARNQQYPSVRDRQRYGKDKRPVNLFRSGKFLNHLTTWAKGLTLSIGFKNPGTRIHGSATIEDLFNTHNEGDHKDVPQRQFLPTGDNDTFKRQIMLSIERKFRELIQNRIK